MNTKLALQILIGVVGYSVWAVMAYIDPSVRGNFLNFNIGMAVGTIGLVLRDMRPADTNTPPSGKEGGSASPWLLLGLSVVVLAGCSGLNVSWELVATYNTPHSAPGAPVAVPLEPTK